MATALPTGRSREPRSAGARGPLEERRGPPATLGSARKRRDPTPDRLRPGARRSGLLAAISTMTPGVPTPPAPPLPPALTLARRLSPARPRSPPRRRHRPARARRAGAYARGPRHPLDGRKAAAPAAPRGRRARRPGGEPPAETLPRREQGVPGRMKLVEGEYCNARSNAAASAAGTTSRTRGDDLRGVRPRPGPLHRRQDEEALVCIANTYEWPNKEGSGPEVMNRFHQAQVKCAAVGKRLCTESEWTLACEGPEMKPFPYGYSRDADEVQRRPPLGRSRHEEGREARPGRAGPPLEGRAERVAARVHQRLWRRRPARATPTRWWRARRAAGWRGKFDSVHTGGPWYKGVRNQCRPKIYTHDEGFLLLLPRASAAAPSPTARPPSRGRPRQVKEGWDSGSGSSGWRSSRSRRCAGSSSSSSRASASASRPTSCARRCAARCSGRARWTRRREEPAAPGNGEEAVSGEGACQACGAARRGRLHATACGLRYMLASVSIATTRLDQ